jgi:hypothetical protein
MAKSKLTATEWLWYQSKTKKELDIFDLEIAKEKEKQEMLEFGSRVAERWGLTSVEPHYIEDEYNKMYKGFSTE